MNQATYLTSVDKARREAREAADIQCIWDVCSLCAKGYRAMPLANHCGYWHRLDGEWSDWPCRASGIHERRAREAEANHG